MENPRFSEMKLCFLGTFGIIESAAKIPFRNPNFVTLTLITSFPLFCLTLLQKFPYLIIDALERLGIISVHLTTISTTSVDISRAVYLSFQILMVYLFSLVNILSVLTTIHAASTIYTSNERSIISLRKLLQSSGTKRRWHERMLTFLSISLLCSLSLSAVEDYTRLLVPSGRPTRLSRLSLAIYWIVYSLAFAKWLEYSVQWNLSVVVSILEQKRGLFEAISASSELSKGNRVKGLLLMLCFLLGDSICQASLPDGHISTTQIYLHMISLTQSSCAWARLLLGSFSQFITAIARIVTTIRSR